MNASDVLGYADTENGGPMVCSDCATPAQRQWAPIFADSETDCPSHCETCGDLIPENLTPDGVRYVREAIENGPGDGDGAALRQWWAAYASVIEWTPADFHLGDDGTMDTVIVCPDGTEERFSFDVGPGDAEEATEDPYGDFVASCKEDLAADWEPRWLTE